MIQLLTFFLIKSDYHNNFTTILSSMAISRILKFSESETRNQNLIRKVSLIPIATTIGRNSINSRTNKFVIIKKEKKNSDNLLRKIIKFGSACTSALCVYKYKESHTPFIIYLLKIYESITSNYCTPYHEQSIDKHFNSKIIFFVVLVC